MISEKIGEIEILRFDNLSKFPQITHFVSTRKGGVSKPPYDSLNLSFKSNEDEDELKNVIENRRRLAEAAGISAESFVFCKQVHSGNVAVVTEQQRGSGVLPETSITDTDSMVSNEPNLCLSVFAADCVPILLFDPVKNVIGAAHSGWKGTVAKIVQNAISTMSEEFGTDPKDLIVGIGPSIGQESYEVDTPVVEAFDEVNLKEFVLQTDEMHGLLDLKQANKRLLLDGGVLEKNIEVSEIDTFKNTDKFYSDRKERPTGRFLASIMLF